MAKLQHSIPLISVCLLSIAHLCFPSEKLPDIHDLLPQYNLPRGILPKDIKSYSLSGDSFTVELSSKSCYVNFDGHLVYFDKVIKGKLGFGKVRDVSGIQTRKLFLWVSVTGIDVEKEGLRFYVGALSEILPAENFEKVHSCKRRGIQADSIALL